MILMIISFSFYSYIAHLALDGYTFQGSNIRVSFANPSKSTQVHLLILAPLFIMRIKILKVCFLLECSIIPLSKAGFFQSYKFRYGTQAAQSYSGKGGGSGKFIC